MYMKIQMHLVWDLESRKIFKGLNFYMMSRPWVKGCDHPLTEEYVKYKKMTPWPNLEEDNRPAKARFKYALWHSVPQSLLALVAGFIYNEVRPKMWWRNE